MIEMRVDVQEILREGVERTDRALERLLPPVTETPASIHEAMRHSVFAGGKRLRPTLTMEAARTISAVHGGTKSREGLPEGIEDLGAAIEMLHTYSLIHDDLPALDNDDLRRGKPTCHVAFGEAIAILAGDALQTLAYQTLAGMRCTAERAIKIVGRAGAGSGGRAYEADSGERGGHSSREDRRADPGEHSGGGSLRWSECRRRAAADGVWHEGWAGVPDCR
jgi:geranylgeranyl diphosphate synthase type II